MVATGFTPAMPRLRAGLAPGAANEAPTMPATWVPWSSGVPPVVPAITSRRSGWLKSIGESMTAVSTRRP